MFLRGGCSHEISIVIAERCTKSAPPSRCLDIERQDLSAVERYGAIKPSGKGGGEVRISRALPGNPTFNFADADDAEEEIARALPLDPGDHRRIALATA
jgi:hypothetical protein